jgi:hypothetical protein
LKIDEMLERPFCWKEQLVFGLSVYEYRFRPGCGINQQPLVVVLPELVFSLATVSIYGSTIAWYVLHHVFLFSASRCKFGTRAIVAVPWLYFVKTSQIFPRDDCALRRTGNRTHSRPRRLFSFAFVFATW